MKKNQDPKEALKALIAEAREHAAAMEAACALLDKHLAGEEPANPMDYLDKMSALYDGRLTSNHLRGHLQAAFVEANKTK